MVEIRSGREIFFTKREEIHPNLHANGVETTKYFKDNFGFTARESIALLEGAHSFGKFHREVSMHKYAWNRMQTRLLNNQQFRNIANEPMFKAVCKKNHPLILLGNVIIVDQNFLVFKKSTKYNKNLHTSC